MSDPAWRPVPFTTEERLRAAERVLDHLRARHGSNLLAVAVEGSTAKGLDRPESDLELCVVLAGGEADRWYAAFHRGLFVGVSLVSPEEAEREAESVTYTWPVDGDRLWTARVLYDPMGLYVRLRALRVGAEAAADWARLAREALADMYEHVYKVFAARPDRETQAYEAAQVAFWAADAVALVNRYRYLSSRTMFAESQRLRSLPEGYAAHLRGLLARPEGVGLERHAAGLWTACRAWAAALGIHLEDDDLRGLA